MARPTDSSVAISLGWNCNVAQHAVASGVRATKRDGYATCPFDLMVSNYPGVVQCIRDDFACFCDPAHLTMWQVPPDAKYNGGESLIFNTKYRFIYNHESPGHANLFHRESWQLGRDHFVQSGFEKFIERYAQRIANFRAYLNSGSEVQFVLHRCKGCDNSELEDAIRTAYPTLRFKITTLTDMPASATVMLLDHLEDQMRLPADHPEIALLRDAVRAARYTV